MKKIITILIVLLFFSCQSNDDDNFEEDLVYKPWNEKIYNLTNQINGISVLDKEFAPSTTNIDLHDVVCEKDLPNGDFRTVKIFIAIPKHPKAGYRSGIGTFISDRITIRFNNGEITSDIFKSGSVKFRETINDFSDSTKEISIFSVEAEIPSNYKITKENLEYINFPFYLKYLDENGEEIYKSERSYTLLSEIC